MELLCDFNRSSVSNRAAEVPQLLGALKCSNDSSDMMENVAIPAAFGSWLCRIVTLGICRQKSSACRKDSVSRVTHQTYEINLVHITISCHSGESVVTAILHLICRIAMSEDDVFSGGSGMNDSLGRLPPPPTTLLLTIDSQTAQTEYKFKTVINMGVLGARPGSDPGTSHTRSKNLTTRWLLYTADQEERRREKVRPRRAQMWATMPILALILQVKGEIILYLVSAMKLFSSLVRKDKSSAGVNPTSAYRNVQPKEHLQDIISACLWRLEADAEEVFYVAAC
ncbi:uncharacterized protein LOC144039765 [Vanacampus margaritifer]